MVDEGWEAEAQKKETTAGTFYGMNRRKVFPSNFGAVAMADLN